jgi:hypothetical protein
LEKTRLDVIDVFSDNQLNNLFMKLHNKISAIFKVSVTISTPQIILKIIIYILKTKEDTFIEYNGQIRADDLEKNHTFGVDFSEHGKIHLIVLKDGKCFEIPCHIANVDETYFEEVDRVGLDDFTRLLDIVIESFNSNETRLTSTQIFTVSITFAYLRN